MPSAETSSELAAVRPVFHAVVVTVVPPAGELDASGWRRLERVVEDALASRTAAERRQLRLLLRAIHWLPVLRWGRPFTGLPADARRRVLSTLQDAPILLLRRGFWGLRTLAYMGYYAPPDRHGEIGYRAHRRGRRGRDEATAGRGRGELPAQTPGPER